MKGDYIPEPGEPISPGALRTVANWLDLFDEMAANYWTILENNGVGDPEHLAKAREATAGKTMQEDLRRWADEMEAQP